MPAVERVEGDAYKLAIPSMPDPLNQHPLPQLIINERGETLDEHVARTQPNFVSALSIMIQLAQVIERLHSVGWVHRDVKPSNCLFVAQPARWALIDWACAAKAGTHFRTVCYSCCCTAAVCCIHLCALGRYLGIVYAEKN